MRQAVGWRITLVILGIWVVWSLACYEPREDRCAFGQARCAPDGAVTYAETCVANDSGPYYFQRDACYAWAGTCRVGEDWNTGARRAFCAASDEPDPRCSPGAFFDQCTENGWIRCADGYVAFEATCPFSAACVLSTQGTATCGEATETSPFCDEEAAGYVCDGDVSVRCEGGFEASRWVCPETQFCAPQTGRCATRE